MPNACDIFHGHSLPHPCYILLSGQYDKQNGKKGDGVDNNNKIVEQIIMAFRLELVWRPSECELEHFKN